MIGRYEYDNDTRANLPVGICQIIKSIIICEENFSIVMSTVL